MIKLGHKVQKIQAACKGKCLLPETIYRLFKSLEKTSRQRLISSPKLVYSTMMIYNNNPYCTALKNDERARSGLSPLKPHFGSRTNKQAPPVPQLKGATIAATRLFLLNCHAQTKVSCLC